MSVFSSTLHDDFKIRLFSLDPKIWVWPSDMTACYNFGLLNLFSEFEIMINPQVKREEDGKKSLKSIKKFLPQLSSMAKKEGLGIKKEEGKKGPIKVDTVISAFKDEKVSIKV